MARVPTEPAPARIVPPGFPRRALWVLLALALILRLGTNLSRVDECFQEGLVRGSLASAMLEGAPIWPSHAPQIPHIRGSVVMSWISVPFFAVFGPTTFAVRLSGILFHLAGLVTLMLLMHRQYGRRAAALAGALWVLAPPSLAKIAVLSYGDHVESLPFLFLAALLVLAWIDDRTGRRVALAFAAGIVCGLGVGWHAQSRLGIATLALFVLLAAPRKIFTRECWLGLVPGALVGLIPHALGDWITARNGLLVQGEGPGGLLGRGIGAEQAGKWLGFWTRDLAVSLQYPWRGAAWILLALAAACAGGLVLFRRTGPDGATAKPADARSWLARSGWFVIYPAVFSVVFALSRYIISDSLANAIAVRYVLPAVPFLLLPIAVGGARLADAGRTALAAAVVVPALALGAWGSLSTWDIDSILHEPARRAGQMEHAGKHFLYGSLDDEEKAALRTLELSLYGKPKQDLLVDRYLAAHADPEAALDTIARFEDTAEWTWPLRYRLPTPSGALHAAESPEGIPVRLARIPERLRPYALALSAREMGKARTLRLEHFVALVRAAGTDDERRAALRGFGEGLCVIWPHVLRAFDGRKAAARIEALPPDFDKHEVAFGFGFKAGSELHAFAVASPIPIRRALQHLPAELHPALARGVGAGYRLRFIDLPAATVDSPGVRHVLDELPERLHAAFREGLGGAGG
jgi:4-amino-4-deoxy-L-arabinose transferase-like glycosyltransferase